MFFSSRRSISAALVCLYGISIAGSAPLPKPMDASLSRMRTVRAARASIQSEARTSRPNSRQKDTGDAPLTIASQASQDYDLGYSHHGNQVKDQQMSEDYTYPRLPSRNIYIIPDPNASSSSASHQHSAFPQQDWQYGGALDTAYRMPISESKLSSVASVQPYFEFLGASDHGVRPVEEIVHGESSHVGAGPTSKRQPPRSTAASESSYWKALRKGKQSTPLPRILEAHTPDFSKEVIRRHCSSLMTPEIFRLVTNGDPGAILQAQQALDLIKNKRLSPWMKDPDVTIEIREEVLDKLGRSTGLSAQYIRSNMTKATKEQVFAIYHARSSKEVQTLALEYFDIGKPKRGWINGSLE
ncbi:hypothetical protein CBS101457_000272 [Exobasidium rhododendri]|nr:hypothetical protein CBS101457_000272 [Exobasidium rhododendri]